MKTALNISGNRRGLYEHRNQKPDRPYCFETKGIWKSNVRKAGDRKTYIGSYPTKEAATAAANHFIATGSKPAPGLFGGATRRGPKGGNTPKPRKRQNPPQTHKATRTPSKPRTEAAARSTQPVKLSHEDRVALWRAAYQKVQGI